MVRKVLKWSRRSVTMKAPSRIPPRVTAPGDGITTVTMWLPSFPMPSVMLLLSRRR